MQMQYCVACHMRDVLDDKKLSHINKPFILRLNHVAETNANAMWFLSAKAWLVSIPNDTQELAFILS